jgi:hypothetical protein
MGYRGMQMSSQEFYDCGIIVLDWDFSIRGS